VLGLTGGTETLIIYIAAAVIGAAILGLGRAFMKALQKRQTDARQAEDDKRILSYFLFDQPRDPSTGTPAKQGWTTTVDIKLESLTKSQERMDKMLGEILYELKPNGGGNFRGAVERNAVAARAEVDAQILERKRIQERDRIMDSDT